MGSGIRLASSVAVGPLVVPYAVDVVSLAAYLASTPLAGQSRAFPEVANPTLEPAAKTLTPEPEASGSDRSRGRRSRDGQRKRTSLAEDEEDIAEDNLVPEVAIPESGGLPTPETHILVDLLRDKDFYHASASITGNRQRAKRRVLGAKRFAEISLLRRSGWRVVCIAEHQWTNGAAGDLDVSQANKQLIFNHVAGLDDGTRS